MISFSSTGGRMFSGHSPDPMLQGLTSFLMEANPIAWGVLAVGVALLIVAIWSMHHENKTPTCK